MSFLLWRWLFGFAGEVSENGDEIWAQIPAYFTPLAAYSFMIFNLLCAPCFAAMGAIKREMNNGKWTAAAIGYMCLLAYCTSLVVYQIGGLITGEVGLQLLHHRGGGDPGAGRLAAGPPQQVRERQRGQCGYPQADPLQILT